MWKEKKLKIEGGIWPGPVYCLRGLGWVATKPLKLLILLVFFQLQKPEIYSVVFDVTSW